jgi:hypothetical protein
MYCIALDPGGTTGVASVESELDPWTIEARQFSGDHHLQLLCYLSVSAPQTIVCESFYHTANEAARLSSSEMIGIVKAYSQGADVPVVWQAPATGKAFWTDDKLKDHGLYVVGLRHARDAIRHYAHWRAFTLKDRSILVERKGTVTRL